MPSMIVDPVKCSRCGVCVKACPVGIVNFGETGFPGIDANASAQCVKCGHCALFCPASANHLSFLKNEEMIEVSGLRMPSGEEAVNFIKTRRSIRRFKKETISKEVFEQIFDVVRLAPTASNQQPVRWVLSADPEKTKEIANLILCWMREEIFKDPTSRISLIGINMIAKAREGEDALLRGAPHVAVAVVPGNHMWPEDGSIALTYLELAAHALGIGACWGGFLTAAIRNFEGLRKYLGISSEEHICGAQMLGYPLIKPVRQYPKRKQLNISWIK